MTDSPSLLSTATSSTHTTTSTASSTELFYQFNRALLPGHIDHPFHEQAVRLHQFHRHPDLLDHDANHHLADGTPRTVTVLPS